MMRSELKIKLEWEDLVEGKRQNTGACAVSHAIKRLYPMYNRPETNRRTISISDPKEGKRYDFATPLVVVRFTKGFDDGVITPDDYVDLTFYLRKDEALVKPMATGKSDTATRHAQDVARKERLADETPAQKAKRERLAAQRKAAARKGHAVV